MRYSAPEIGAVKVNAQLAYRFPKQRPPCSHFAIGRREEKIESLLRGKYARARLPDGGASDVALDATLRAAAVRVCRERAEALEVRPGDVRQKVRRHRSPYLVAFVVDNSWSMHVERTLEETKGVVMGLLKDARVFHDRVALIAFRHSRNPEAAVCLPLTSSYALATDRLRKIPLSGATPLPDGIRKAYRLLSQEVGKHHNAIPVLVTVTDGLPNIPLRRGGDPYRDVSLLCRRLRRDRISTIVVDTEPSGPEAGRSCCREMAALSGGAYLPFSQLTSEAIHSILAQDQAGRAKR